MKPAKILYFIDGHAPTPEDMKAAAKLSATVVFRNAQRVPSEAHAIEHADGVAGNVPKIYADAYPPAEDAIKAKADALEELSKKVGDSKAPKASKKSEQPAPAAPPGNKQPGNWQAGK